MITINMYFCHFYGFFPKVYTFPHEALNRLYYLIMSLPIGILMYPYRFKSLNLVLASGTGHRT